MNSSSFDRLRMNGQITLKHIHKKTAINKRENIKIK